jgi:hypothetical protein
MAKFNLRKITKNSKIFFLKKNLIQGTTQGMFLTSLKIIRRKLEEIAFEIFHLEMAMSKTQEIRKN